MRLFRATPIAQFLALSVWLSMPVLLAEDLKATPDQVEFFERDIRPLLVEHCYACHSVQSDSIKAGLRLDSRDAMLSGGDSGPSVVPGELDRSPLIEAVRYDGYEMPPTGKLPAAAIEKFERWVEMGAPWPDEELPTAVDLQPTFDLAQRKRDHWVWQPIQSPVAPAVEHTAWPLDDVDRFLLARLETAGLEPSKDAGRTALMRRLYFDLIGLPPTFEQTEAFLSDDSDDAVELLVDELLKSPHFGERWGRHWLDLVRFAESRGHEFDNDAPNAFQYRDYVIRAFNEDVPYDQFVREHIAGDLLSEPRLNPEHQFNESILGTGFWFLGEWVHSPVDIRKDELDRFDNMIDVMSKTFLGVTVSCARCHDHKFDAISTADYYSLTGFLQGSDYQQVRFESIEHNRNIAQRLAQLDKEYRERIADRLAEANVQMSVSGIELEINSSQIVVDYASIDSKAYLQNGFIFGPGPTGTGIPYWVTRKNQSILEFTPQAAAINDPFWDGLESQSEAPNSQRNRLHSIPRSGRTLRTPTFTLTRDHVDCLVRGSGHVVACVDSHRLVAGPLHGETVRAIDGTDPWVRLNLQRYIGHRLHLEFTPANGSQLQIHLVLQGSEPEQRQSINDQLAAASMTANEFESAALDLLSRPDDNLIAEWSSKRSELQASIQCQSRIAMAMLDGPGEDAHVYIRGNASKPGKVEPRHFLTAISGDSPIAISSGSGRLELAHHINSPSNPLTTRVIVNRVWHHLMGRGIVPTTDDFGVLGQRPTHPELLDYLATEFVSDGQSLKRLIRRLVLTRTYRMGSQMDPKAVENDPKNLLHAYRPPSRLEGEAIRDSLLALAGSLDATLFGESIPVHLTPFMDGRGRPNENGPLDGQGRRSIYTEVRRNFLSPFMLTFDTPNPFSTMGRRNVSNVPAQSLILMNDPFVVQQATHWSVRAMAYSTDPQTRIAWMIQSAFARPATAGEIEAAEQFLSAQAADRNVPVNDPVLWADLAHALINTKEFIFLR